MSVDPKSTYYDIGGYSVWEVLIQKARHIHNPILAILFFQIAKYALRWPFKHRHDNEGMIRDAEKIEVYAGMLKHELGVDNGKKTAEKAKKKKPF